MSLKQKIIDDLKNAMKAGETAKRDTLRMLDSMIKNTEIEKKKREEGLSDEEIQEVIARAIKQRRDSATQYVSGGREDLAQKENTEIEILSVYMPAQLSDEEARTEVLKIIAEVGAVSKSEIGKVMGKAMTVLKGKVDGNLVKKIAEEELK
ncbi:MAG: GatB/Yqey domain protein [Candidatus Moranbacteria bacterium GW2011_GWF2_36_839]|nr:MAG: GatB/Yqey domain protein [Candidatus Moranbacteria bacterium GW2011_GWF1_36_78]KKQ17302.1 MAG: GatB/Yqey domain protein [Candidatus Moranbacteria bacterium GW2011_GWF2_36_839]HAT73853.1 glutamyl-tRNA amidotransferase [Candidatus Moranbacteria bacterium]HBY11004.1 glutamyl-tRNA amidotransferase [Candidatus Moranbacteria bacterium]